MLNNQAGLILYGMLGKRIHGIGEVQKKVSKSSTISKVAKLVAMCIVIKYVLAMYVCAHMYKTNYALNLASAKSGIKKPP